MTFYIYLFSFKTHKNIINLWFKIYFIFTLFFFLFNFYKRKHTLSSTEKYVSVSNEILLITELLYPCIALHELNKTQMSKKLLFRLEAFIVFVQLEKCDWIISFCYLSWGVPEDIFQKCIQCKDIQRECYNVNHAQKWKDDCIGLCSGDIWTK